MSLEEWGIVTDTYHGKGSLGGICISLTTSDSFYTPVVCDKPFLNQALLDYMMRISTSFDQVVPPPENMLEPYRAVYAKGCLAPVESLTEVDSETAREVVRGDMSYDKC